MKKTFKTTVNGEELSLSVIKPNLAQQNEADALYARTKIKLLNRPRDERPLPQSQVRVKLREAGVISDERQKELDELDVKIGELEKVLETGVRVEDGQDVKLTKLDGRKVALELVGVRFTKLNLLAEIEEFARDITLERIAEREQLDYLVAVCTLDENNKKYFKSLEEYQSRRGDQDAVDARVNFENLLAEADTDWREGLIEWKFLKKYSYVDDKWRLVNEKGQLVDVDMKRIDEEGNYLDEDGKKIENAPSEVGEFL